MDMLARLHAYFHAVDPERTIDVVSITEAVEDAAAPDITETLMLACTPASFRPAPPVPELRFLLLNHNAPLAAIQANLDINERGFDPGAAPVSAAAAEAFRSTLITNYVCTAILHESPVAAGMFTPPAHGFAEIVGLTTLHAYRQRGIAAALTSELVRAAFAQGVEIAIMSTSNPVADRIYRRIGFAPALRYIRRPESDHSS